MHDNVAPLRASSAPVAVRIRRCDGVGGGGGRGGGGVGRCNWGEGRGLFDGVGYGAVPQGGGEDSIVEDGWTLLFCQDRLTANQSPCQLVSISQLTHEAQIY